MEEVAKGMQFDGSLISSLASLALFANLGLSLIGQEGPVKYLQGFSQLAFVTSALMTGYGQLKAFRYRKFDL